MKLRSKLIIGLVILIILPLVTGIGITYVNIRNNINTINEKQAYSDLDSASNYINFLVNNHKNSYTAWTPWGDFYNAINQKDTQWINDNVFSSVKDDTNNEAVVVINADGTVLSEDNAPSAWQNINFKDFNLFKNLTGNTPCASGLELTSDGLYIASLAKVVQDDDTNFTKWDGYILYARKIKNSETVNGALNKGLIDLGKDIVGDNITLKLDNGIVLSTGKNNMPVNYKSSDFKNGEVKLTQQINGNIMKIQTEKVLYDAGGKPIGVLSVETQSNAGIVALNELAKNSIVLLLILIISVIILFAVIRSISLKPLSIMVGEFNKIASGNLTDVDEGKLLVGYLKRKDEIGNFAKAFETMKTNLRNMLSSINNSVTVVADTSNILSDISQNTSQAADQTSATISSMAEEAMKQSNYSESIVKMMEDTQNHIDKGANELTVAVESINRARNITNISNKSMKDASNYVEVMSLSLNKSSESIAKLKEHSSKIGSIVGTIRGITEQTNLLALNAAIEAARAGEYGRGFAVVAEEIRKLSEESSDETKHIEKLVEDIQKETDLTVETIENNFKAFENQAALIKNGESGLGDVVENINKAEENSKMLQEILGVINERIDNTFVNIKKIIDSINDSAKGSEQLAAASQEQLAAINQLAQSAQDLSKLAENLENEISKFNV